jgi:1-deoxy-D-xylulose-5-phosphate reductoisomerase
VPVTVPSPSLAPSRRRVVVLGSTGSIGTNCLDVLAHLPGRFEVLGLSAHGNGEALCEQARRWRPRWVTVTDPDAAARLDRRRLPDGTRLLVGDDGLATMVTDPDADVVVSAIVGSAGLYGTWAALEAGKTVALANKETLVVAGPLVMDLAARRGGLLLPVDSEHSAIFQALQGARRGEVERVVLTASGGPFRGKRAAEVDDVTVD